MSRPEVAARILEIRLEARRLGEMADRLLGSSLLVEKSPQIVVGLRVVRFQANRLGKMADSPLGVSLFEHGKAKVVMRLRKSGIEAQCRRILCNRFTDPALQVEGTAQRVCACAEWGLRLPAREKCSAASSFRSSLANAVARLLCASA